MGKNSMARQLQAHLDEHAAYGGHDGHGGAQKPKDKQKSKTLPLVNPNPTTLFRENSNRVPVAGPATGAGAMGGPVGTGTIGGR
jgi:hypothetical protein